MSTLLFVDDDPAILESNRIYFQKLDYQVICATSAREALNIISSVTLDCIILDIDMPEMDGFDICRRLRTVSGVPVIFLSGLTEQAVRVKSFLVGGDDYLGKPFSIRELALRIEARTMGRQRHLAGDELHFGDLIIDTGRRVVRYQAELGEFTALQFDVLAFLAQHPDQVFSYEQIYDYVWKSPILGSRHNLQSLMSNLRQKLVELCCSKRYIETVPRKGYRFVVSPSEEERA